MIETGRGSYGSQGQDFTPAAGSAEGHAMEGQYGGHQGALAGGQSFMSGSTGPLGRFEDHDRTSTATMRPIIRGSAGVNYGYERYQPAYQYGWQLGEQYQGRDWRDFEGGARSDWERSHPNDAWQDFRAAIYEGWNRFKSGVGSQGAEQPYKGVEQGRQPDAGLQDARRSRTSHARC